MLLVFAGGVPSRRKCTGPPFNLAASPDSFFLGGADVSDVNARDRLIAWPPVLLRPAFSGSTHQNHFKLSTPDLLLSPLNETTADRPRVRRRAACSDYLIHRDIFHSAK